MLSGLSDIPVHSAKGIGPRRADLFARIGIKTIQDLLYYLPYRYEDRAHIKKMCDVREGFRETVKGRVISTSFRMTRPKRFSMFEIVLHDGSGILKGIWFNQPFMKNNIKVGQEIFLNGTVKRRHESVSAPEMENPDYEDFSDEPDSSLHVNRIIPFYRLTDGMSQKVFRRIMFSILESALSEIDDPMPAEIATRLNLLPLQESIRQVHFPESSSGVDSLNAKTSDFHRRLIFDELFLFSLGMAISKKKNACEPGIAFASQGRMRESFIKMLPFSLTAEQKRVLDEIIGDMSRPIPMNRLLLGDVGSGKTVIAVAAILSAVECGYQAAFMLPTQILAEQHYLNMHMYFERLGLDSELLAGNSVGRRLAMIAAGDIPIVFGTHAIFQERIHFNNLGLVIVDEQHKFGVMQRKLLRDKGMHPDVLVMTATPIPRSLALTAYGDLDCSIIDQLPPGRKPVITRVFMSSDRHEIYEIMRNEICRGRQVYVVYPSIEEPTNGALRSVLQGRAAFEKIFPEFAIGILHGRMNVGEKEEVMRSFHNGEIDILICTSIIEVGVDVQNASVMLVIHAERFGLAQLHQLRGRVGRGGEISYCLLVAYQPLSEDASRRLAVMEQCSNGFLIAEEDLRIRGPGELLGTKQSGMPDFRIADIMRDMRILEEAKREADFLVNHYRDLEEFPSLRSSLGTFWDNRIDLYRTR